MSITYQAKFDGVTILTDGGERFTLSNSDYLGGGKDGEVFRLDSQYAVKVYLENPITTSLYEKLSILCSKRSNFHETVVAPLKIIRLKGQSKKKAAGFIMRYLTDAKPINNIRWNPSILPDEERDFDQVIANFIYDISEGLETLHANRIVMGDLKPQNILVSNLMAYLIDIDSCSILPDYPGDSFTIQYVDPRLREGVPDSRGPYEFSTRTDWWALAIIAFELFMGVSPWSGIHPDFRRDALVFRSFNYSAVLFDDRVRPPTKYLRGREWLESKPRIEKYFRGIFSKDPVSRVPLFEVLNAYFPKEGATAHTSQIINRVESLLLSDPERRFIEKPIKDLQGRALRKAMRRDQVRIRFLDMMFAPESSP